MKRFAWMTLVGLVAFAPPPALAAYDGPGQLTYDQTQNGIGVVFTAQVKIAEGRLQPLHDLRSGANRGREPGPERHARDPEVDANDAAHRGPAPSRRRPPMSGRPRVHCGGFFELVTGIPAAATSVDVYPHVLRGSATRCPSWSTTATRTSSPCPSSTTTPSSPTTPARRNAPDGGPRRAGDMDRPRVPGTRTCSSSWHRQAWLRGGHHRVLDGRQWTSISTSTRTFS